MHGFCNQTVRSGAGMRSQCAFLIDLHGIVLLQQDITKVENRHNLTQFVENLPADVIA